MNNLIPIKKVVPDVNQPRKYFDAAKLATLVKSIKVHGIINPIMVQPEGDHYLLVDGERRYRAAIEIGLKEIPVTILNATDPVTRAIEQFHIQQMHENWTPMEEAAVISDVMIASGTTFMQTCELLNIAPRTARRLFALSKLADKEGFAANNIPLDYADAIHNLCVFVKKLKTEREEDFLKSDQKKLERTVISKIGTGEITKKQDIIQLKDTFRTDPKSYDKFLAGESGESLFIKSKARATYHLRNAVYNSRITALNIKGFLKNPNVTVTDGEVAAFKNCRNEINRLLEKAGKDE